MLFLCSLSVAIAIIASTHGTGPMSIGPIGAQEPHVPDLHAIPEPGVLEAIADETGWDELYARLKGVVPTGAGEIVAMAEAISGSSYAPDVSDPEFAGKNIVLKSGASGVSGHATTVGQHYYGLFTGISPGPTEVRVYEASAFIGNGFLGSTILSTPPKIVNWRVENNSWIGGGGNVLLLKYDYAIEDQDILVASGVNNGTGPLDVPLLSHLFNGIAVGRSDGNHHAGGTLPGYGSPGRQKPEMVAPAGATSYATPLVSGAGALLRETAATHPLLGANPDAFEPEVLKAALMAGAEHRAGWANNAPQTGPTRGLATQPLDALYGADELDVNNAHWILTGGEQPAATSAALATETRHNGWTLTSLAAAESRYWRFEVEAEKPYVSILATWNRLVPSDFSGFEAPEIDAELWSVDGGGNLVSLVGDGGLAFFAAGNVKSASTVDNLEHLYATELAPGAYVLEVARTADGVAASFDVAVGWELKCAEPFTYGTGKLTSTGLTPAMSFRGVPSAAEDDFDISVTDAEPNKSGVFYYGSGQKNAPFYGGTMLVLGPIKRLPMVTTDPNGEVTLPIAIDATMIGAKRNYQFWFRDPLHSDGTGVGLSNAVEIVFCP